MDHLQRFTKIAFRADAPISVEQAIRLAADEECTDVYMVGDNQERLTALRAAGLTVHLVRTRAELPADVFPWFRHVGFWAATRIDNGAVRDVSYAHDSIMATRLLLNRFAPGYREQFDVRPVTIEALDVAF